MLVFIDESGDAGMKLSSGSSPYFCILAVVFSDNFSADACDRGIDELRAKLKLKPGYEFHFTKCSDRIRQLFLNAVSVEQFHYHAFVVNKAKLYARQFNDGKNFYEFAVRIVCENASDLLQDSKVVIDRSGNREFALRLQTTLRNRVLGRDGQKLIREVKMQDSFSNNLVQLADMACGAIARSITSKDKTFRKILKARGREKRVRFWPE